LKEVLEGLSENDNELAEQLVEIRLEQEKIYGKKQAFEIITNEKVELKNKQVLQTSISAPQTSSTSKKVNEDYPSEGTKDFYTAVGNRFVIGYSFSKTDNYGFRTEVSGSSKSDTNKIVDGTSYDFYQKNTSISTYFDWYPFSSNFRLTSGINVNDMRTKLNSKSNGVANINSSQVSLGSNIFNLEFKFPVVTPYVGFGFLDKKIESLGFSYFGDVGLMLGKYNATATTNIIGIQNVTSVDVDSELNKLRKNLFKYSFVPTANFGLTYRYQ
jgi:hypothetical protein